MTLYTSLSSIMRSTELANALNVEGYTSKLRSATVRFTFSFSFLLLALSS